MACVVRVGTTFNHKSGGELGALRQLDTSVVIILEECCQIIVRDSRLSGSIVSRRRNKTTIVWHAHWEIRREILVQSALSVHSLSRVLELRVGSNSLRSVEFLIAVTIRVPINVVLSIIEEGVSSVRVSGGLESMGRPFGLIETGPLNRVQVALLGAGVREERTLDDHVLQ